ncbi:pentapeptide repeat-containing protein [Clostridium estertheticum]|nr:pentapeptide repeat-containing protein [Clostridium estertheticum]MCB2355550.1 pentapeptide repeat-containing protein [Clostridium estertheticum]MCB2357328.1 pentapeptide repeat-containing protein [Clostridium estertheticum]MCB2361921.1 pentapeptide repeat-containing protein [Clostridium estertheticum]WAG43472.1 pentapeptide repeat-containing protein [Clostridium estertheticum]
MSNLKSKKLYGADFKDANLEKVDLTDSAV